ncbi:DUF885 domain-containing protein [Saccharopolyspora sp. NFXS83]|uniref:DUF885 domain-containing protein n=1 Tax=Saccharopolyspora sp. NFXS83 TaxID=2993560 RepID=UPI00224A551C|nr:DUF885 domain-containing protein [Saccharopolyspora sp. NFXS83]MCX2732159.1 DUF885 domain-containing protein [Saccharopolyspora sp. NFXS83]
MDPSELVRGYLRLGLRFGRLDDGMVLSCTADPRTCRGVAGEPVPSPGELVAQAARLRAALPDSGLPEVRARFLDAQLAALECRGKKLTGQAMSFRDEVEGCFRVRPERGDPERYRLVHAELADVLPGTGDPAPRLARLSEQERVPPDLVPRAVRVLSEALRGRVRAGAELPTQEHVRYRCVRGRPWAALHRYLGEFRSLVAIDLDRVRWAGNLPALVAHESYPGHHAEHCRKERLLVDERGWDEHRIAVRDTPQSLLAEGLADFGLHLAVGPGWGRWASEVLAESGIAFDGELAERVHDVLFRLRRVRLDAALSLHEDGVGEDEVVARLVRWACLPVVRARAFVRFIADPRWRLYAVAYAEGAELVRGRIAEGEDLARLLGEPWTPGGLAGVLPVNGRTGPPGGSALI